MGEKFNIVLKKLTINYLINKTLKRGCFPFALWVSEI